VPIDLLSGHLISIGAPSEACARRRLRRLAFNAEPLENAQRAARIHCSGILGHSSCSVCGSTTSNIRLMISHPTSPFSWFST